MAERKDPIRRLTHELSRLPGIGEKTASRLAFHILKMPESYVRELAEALLEVKTAIRRCSVCGNLTAEDPCRLCADPRRRDDVICVVERPSDVLAMERGGKFAGRYHVLHGVLSPLDGVGPEDIRISELLQRLRDGNVKEVIMAMDSDVEGDATALYLARLIRPLGIRATRLAHGLPVGSELEYADQATIQKALDNRQEL